MEPRSLRVTQNAYFSPLTHAKQLLSVTFCDINAGILTSFELTETQAHGWKEGSGGRWTDRHGS